LPGKPLQSDALIASERPGRYRDEILGKISAAVVPIFRFALERIHPERREGLTAGGAGAGGRAEAMKFEIDFAVSPDYVCVRTEGGASVSGFRNLIQALTEAAEWKVGTKQLVDHRKLVPHKVELDDVDQIKEAVEKHSAKLGRGRCAFVVSDRFGFGLMRMYGGLGGDKLHRNPAIFFSLEEADEWLRTDDDMPVQD
jgi:hypothetical protein